MISSAEFRTFLLKVWKDPVWSKVIAAGILLLISVIAARFANYSWNQIYSFVLNVFSYKIPVYLFLSTIALYFIARLIINLIRNKKDPYWDEQIGNYSFKELYNIMLLDTWPIPTQGMEMMGRKAPDEPIMDLFRLYYSILNKGVDFETNVGDGHYLYGSLAPRLVGYGLVDAYEKQDEKVPGMTNVAYRTSQLGHRFHANLDKINLKRKLKEEVAKKKK